MEKNDIKNLRKSFDISTSHWKWRSVQQPSTCPAPRHLHSLVHHNNYLYLFGGFGDEEKYFGDFWQYSFAKRRWKKIKSKICPTARHSHQAVVHQNKMILFGGISEGKTMNDLWTFDFATESWKLEEKTLHAVSGHSMVVYAGKLIVFGGADENVKVTNNLVVLDANTFEALYVKVTNVPSARQYASLVLSGDSIYLFGGFNNNKSLQDFYQIIITVDNQIITQQLEVPSYIENLRGASLSLLSYQSQLILFGGKTNKNLSDATYAFSLVLKALMLRPSSSTNVTCSSGSSKWNTCPSIGPSPRYYHKACEVNGRLIIYGGLCLNEGDDRAVNLNDMWIYSDVDRAALRDQDNLIINPSYIPAEIWSHILSYMNEGKDVESASVVSKQFFNIIRANEMLQNLLKSLHLYTLPMSGNRIKLVVGGMNRSGKSASILQFVSDQFELPYELNIEDTPRRLYTIDDHDYVLELIETDTEEFTAMLEQVYRGAHGVYLVYSITNRESFNMLEFHLSVATRVKEGKKFPLIRVGNKTDLEAERQLTPAEGQEFAKKHGAAWMETSAKTRHNIDKAFEIIVRTVIEADKERNRKDRERHFAVDRPSKKDRCLMM